MAFQSTDGPELRQPVLSATPIAERTDPQWLQVLATEQASLLATRAQTWNESFSRFAAFLALVSGAAVALALVAQATDFREGLTIFAVLLLPVVLFVGAATYVRLCAINAEDLIWVAGMNRLRHAYLEAYPELGRYLVASGHDGMAGIGVTMGMVLPGADAAASRLSQIGHGFVTMPGTLAVVDGVIAAVLVGVIVGAGGVGALVAVILGILAFVVTVAMHGIYQFRSITGWMARWSARFPSAVRSSSASD